MLRIFFVGLFLSISSLFLFADDTNGGLSAPSAKQLLQSAFAFSSQNPINVLVTVIKNPNSEDSSQVNALNNLVANPSEAVNNLFNPNGLISNFGLGFAVHF